MIKIKPYITIITRASMFRVKTKEKINKSKDCQTEAPILEEKIQNKDTNKMQIMYRSIINHNSYMVQINSPYQQHKKN